MAEPARQGRPPRDAGLLLGRFFGVPVYLSMSWLVIAAIMTISYADTVREHTSGLSSGGAYLVSFGIAVLIAASLLAHELGHVGMCLALGLRVRRVVIFLLGGVSEIEGEPTRPREEYLVAIAGPMVTLLLAGAGAVLYPLAEPGTVLRLVLLALAGSNLVVLAFNLLPGLPLDGGKVLRAGVWQVSGSRLTGTRAAAWGGRALAALLALAAVLLVRTDDFAVTVTNMAVAMMVAAFIWIGASQALTVAAIHSRLPDLRVTDLVRPALAVPADLPVSEALRRAWETKAQGLVVVDREGRPTALVSEAHVRALPDQRRPWTTVSEVSRQLEPGLTLPDSAAGEQVLDAVRAHPASEYLVVDAGGRLVGVLATADVAVLLRRWGQGSGERRTRAGAGR